MTSGEGWAEGVTVCVRDVSALYLWATCSLPSPHQCVTLWLCLCDVTASTGDTTAVSADEGLRGAGVGL